MCMQILRRQAGAAPHCIFSDYGEARSELYCPVCQRIEFGTEPEIYQSATYFVDNLEFNHYPGLDDNEKQEE